MKQRKLLVRYGLVDVADCTCDPHPVSYKDIENFKKRLKVMFADILKVCKSDMVQYVRSVSGQIGDVEFESDHYTEHEYSSLKGKSKQAKGEMAKKHKVEGAWFSWDAESGKRHLPPGMTGLRQFIKAALAKPDEFRELCVGVTWAFAGDSSCSDYIKLGCGEYFNNFEGVEYNSQDYWINNEGYLDWCAQMEDTLKRHFQHSGSRQ